MFEKSEADGLAGRIHKCRSRTWQTARLTSLQRLVHSPGSHACHNMARKHAPHDQGYPEWEDPRPKPWLERAVL